MKRIVISILFFFVGAGIAFGISSQLFQKAEISQSLSDRSKKYLASKKEGGVLGTMYMEGGKGKLPVGKKVTVDGCLSFIMPFALKDERKDNECDYTYQIQSPRGSIVAYLRKEPSTDWDSVPGVRMRRQSAFMYDEKERTIDGKTYLVFANKEGGKYERNVFYRTDMSFVVINVTAYTSENLDTKLEELLGSVTIQ